MASGCASRLCLSSARHRWNRGFLALFSIQLEIGDDPGCAGCMRATHSFLRLPQKSRAVTEAAGIFSIPSPQTSGFPGAGGYGFSRNRTSGGSFRTSAAPVRSPWRSRRAWSSTLAPTIATTRMTCVCAASRRDRGRRQARKGSRICVEPEAREMLGLFCRAPPVPAGQLVGATDGRRGMVTMLPS